MKIAFACEKDLEQLSKLDTHITKERWKICIADKRAIVAKENEQICGWLRYSFFWDNIPFVDIIFVLEQYRNSKAAIEMNELFETAIKKQGYKKVLTSSMSNERAQIGHRRVGYKDCGCLLLPDEPLEILFLKEFKDN